MRASLGPKRTISTWLGAGCYKTTSTLLCVLVTTLSNVGLVMKSSILKGYGMIKLLEDVLINEWDVFIFTYY